MIPFLRRWYVVVALIWWLCSLAAFWALVSSPSFHAGPSLFLIVILVPWIVPAVLLATRGFRHTTTARVFVSIYAVILIPTGLFVCFTDVMESLNRGWADRHWTNTWIWFQLALEGGLLASPFVFGFSAVVAYVNNLFAKDSGAD
jgi:hypothetical protein